MVFSCPEPIHPCPPEHLVPHRPGAISADRQEGADRIHVCACIHAWLYVIAVTRVPITKTRPVFLSEFGAFILFESLLAIS